MSEAKAARQHRTGKSHATESRHSSLNESIGLMSRAQTSFSTLSFFLTRLDGLGNPLREWIFMILSFFELMALSAYADPVVVESQVYTSLLGFMRLDVELLPFSAFLVLFWASFSVVLVATAGLFARLSTRWHLAQDLCYYLFY